jgi:tetratricopeptide (TPR) repeat protein
VRFIREEQRCEHLEALLTLFESVRSGALAGPAFVSLEARSGYGKTRIVQELYAAIVARHGAGSPLPARLTGPGASVRQGRKVIGFNPPFGPPLPSPNQALPILWWAARCHADEAGTPHGGLHLAVERLRDLARSEFDNRERRGMMREAAPDIGEAALEIVGGLQVPAVVSLALTGGRSIQAWLRQRRPDAVETELDASLVDQAISDLVFLGRGRRPIVLVVEDAHYADPTLVAFLLRVHDQPLPVRLLTVCTAWPSEVLSQVRRFDAGETDLTFGRLRRELELYKPHTTRIFELSPMGEVELSEFVDHVAPATPGPTRRALTRRAEGNPLALQLMLELDAVRWSIRSDAIMLRPEEISSLPGSLRQIADALWSQLPPDIQALLALASIQGRDFVGELAEHVAVVALSGRLGDPASALRAAVSPHAWVRDVSDSLLTFFEEHNYEIAHAHVDRLGSRVVNEARQALAAYVIARRTEATWHALHHSLRADLLQAHVSLARGSMSGLDQLDVAASAVELAGLGIPYPEAVRAAVDALGWARAAEVHRPADGRTADSSGPDALSFDPRAGPIVQQAHHWLNVYSNDMPLTCAAVLEADVADVHDRYPATAQPVKWALGNLATVYGRTERFDDARRAYRDLIESGLSAEERADLAYVLRAGPLGHERGATTLIEELARAAEDPDERWELRREAATGLSVLRPIEAIAHKRRLVHEAPDPFRRRAMEIELAADLSHQRRHGEAVELLERLAGEAANRKQKRQVLAILAGVQHHAGWQESELATLRKLQSLRPGRARSDLIAAEVRHAPELAPEMLRQLRETPGSKRNSAARASVFFELAALGRIDLMVDAAAQALHDEDDAHTLQEEMVAALSNESDELSSAAIAVLRGRLSDAITPACRHMIEQTIEGVLLEQAPPPLEELLDAMTGAPDGSMGRWALDLALRNPAGHQELTLGLEERLADCHNEEERHHAMWWLAQALSRTRRPADAVPLWAALIDDVRSGPERMRLGAALALDQFRSGFAASAAWLDVRAHVSDDPLAAAAAAREMGRALAEREMPQEAASLVRTAMNQPDADVCAGRWALAEVLANADPPGQAIEVLRDLMDGEQGPLRKQALALLTWELSRAGRHQDAVVAARELYATAGGDDERMIAREIFDEAGAGGAPAPGCEPPAFGG